jgi:fumarate hydratase class II
LNRATHRAHAFANCAERSISLTLRAAQGSPLILATALVPSNGYDKASQIAHHALEKGLALRATALKLGFVGESEFDRIVDPQKMTEPYVASAPTDIVHALVSTRSDA